MLLSFSLSMPNCGSWNGKWSGDGNPYVIIKTFRSNDEIANAESMVAKGLYHYSWDDGWVAVITVKEVTSYEAQVLRRQSKGFHGYEWMVDTIIRYGKPLADHQIAKHLESQKVKHVPCAQTG